MSPRKIVPFRQQEDEWDEEFIDQQDNSGALMGVLFILFILGCILAFAWKGTW